MSQGANGMDLASDIEREISLVNQNMAVRDNYHNEVKANLQIGVPILQLQQRNIMLAQQRTQR